MNEDRLKALREKEVAERMIVCSEYVEAREHLLEAQRLFPGEDNSNITALLTVCDIITAASVEVPGCGTDHYWVLQAMPSSTLADVKWRYQKLVTLLQPLKTKFQCTGLALALAHTAFSVLTDYKKRSEFDLRRGTSWENYTSLDVHKLTVALQKRPLLGFYNFEDDRKPEHFEAGQIWCVSYKAVLDHSYRYARIHSTSKAATCVSWLKPMPVTRSERRWCDAGLPVACGTFEVALEMQMSIEARWAKISSYKCCWTRGIADGQFEIYPKKGEIWAVYKGWNLDDWAYNPDSLKGCKFELVEILSDFSKYLGAPGACLVRVDGFERIFERQTIGGNTVTFHIPPNNLYIFSHFVPAYRFKDGEMDKVAACMFELDQLALPDYMNQDTDTEKTQQRSTRIAPDYTIQATDTEKTQQRSTRITPDYMIQDTGTRKMQQGSARFEPDSTFTRQTSFVDFSSEDNVPFNQPGDKVLMPGWSQLDFSAGQIWAVYWGKAIVPRKYVQINSVILRKQVSVTFLDPQPVPDLGNECKKKDIPIATGIFKVSETRVHIDMSRFSHLVRCQESISRAQFKILPLKGEIWAMYIGWNARWRISDYERNQFQVVQILSNFSEEDGIRVARLVRVKGCLTFFQTQQHNGFDLSRVLLRVEMLSFSHRIPAFRVPGIGKFGIPERSWHLEPNALPFKSEK